MPENQIEFQPFVFDAVFQFPEVGIGYNFHFEPDTFFQRFNSGIGVVCAIVVA